MIAAALCVLVVVSQSGEVIAEEFPARVIAEEKDQPLHELAVELQEAVRSLRENEKKLRSEVERLQRELDSLRPKKQAVQGDLVFCVIETMPFCQPCERLKEQVGSQLPQLGWDVSRDFVFERNDDPQPGVSYPRARIMRGGQELEIVSGNVTTEKITNRLRWWRIRDGRWR